MKVLVIDATAGEPVTDAMWEEYLASPVPDGFEATDDVRDIRVGEYYLNPVNVWSGLPPEAIFAEDYEHDYTHFRIGDGPLKTIDEPPVARRILRRL